MVDGVEVPACLLPLLPQGLGPSRPFPSMEGSQEPFATCRRQAPAGKGLLSRCQGSPWASGKVCSEAFHGGSCLSGGR